MVSRRAVVVGSGPCGNAATLALARSGWTVTVVDRDASAPPEAGGSPDVEGWDRSGVAQFHQPHAFLARLFAELRASLPDVLDALMAAGAVQVDLPMGMSAAWCRRSTLELVMQRAVAAQPGARVVVDDAAAVEHADGRVTGVRLRSGSVLEADLVVDAGGRRSRVSRPWRSIGDDESSDEVYTSRRYRLRSGRVDLPVNRGVISVAESDGYAALIFPHDAGTFTAVLTRLPDDDDLTALRHEEVFEAALAQVPMTAAWIDPSHAEPITGVRVMAGLRNTFNPLREDAPFGLHAVGDVVGTTNPHFGRGTALAVASALRLADAVAVDPTDARTWRVGTTAWEQGELKSWCDDGRELDRCRGAMWRAALTGTDPGSAMAAAATPGRVPRIAILAAAGRLPQLRPVVMRHMHLVDPPETLLAMEPLVADLMATGWSPVAGEEGADAPTRARLVEALAPLTRRAQLLTA